MSDVIIPNNFLSPLPIYATEGRRECNKWYSYGRKSPIFMVGKTIPPFQIKTDYNLTLYSARLHYADGTTADILSSSSMFKKENMGDFTIHYCLGGEIYSLNPVWGSAYISMEIGGRRTGVANYFSEIFEIIPTMKLIGEDCLLKIEWWDDYSLFCDAGAICYGNNYHNSMIVKSDVGYPDYEFEEEGEEREGLFFPTRQLTKKVYHFNVIGTESMADALRVAPISDYVRITQTDKNGSKVFNTRAFSMNVDWQEQGYYAAIQCEFEIETIMKKLGRGTLINSLQDSEDTSYSPSR